MKVGDLVYTTRLQSAPDHIKTIGMIVETYKNECSVFAILVKGIVYDLPRCQLVLVLQ
jgi:hypothetical protein